MKFKRIIDGEEKLPIYSKVSSCCTLETRRLGKKPQGYAGPFRAKASQTKPTRNSTDTEYYQCRLVYNSSCVQNNNRYSRHQSVFSRGGDWVLHPPSNFQKSNPGALLRSAYQCIEKPVVSVGNQMKRSFPGDYYSEKKEYVFLFSRFYRNDRNITVPFASWWNTQFVAHVIFTQALPAFGKISNGTAHSRSVSFSKKSPVPFVGKFWPKLVSAPEFGGCPVRATTRRSLHL